MLSNANAERGMRNAESPVRTVEVKLGGDPPYAGWQPAYTGPKPPNIHVAPNGEEVFAEEIQNPKSAIRNRKQRFLIFAVLLLVFVGGLYGTSAFLRSRGIIPAISAPWTAKTGRANTDINLRPEPNANNDPIGLVTKNSRVRILKMQDNWYQVEILEQGRDRSDQLSTTRGWLNGRYVDLD